MAVPARGAQYRCKTVTPGYIALIRELVRTWRTMLLGAGEVHVLVDGSVVFAHRSVKGNADLNRAVVDIGAEEANRPCATRVVATS